MEQTDRKGEGGGGGTEGAIGNCIKKGRRNEMHLQIMITSFVFFFSYNNFIVS